MDADAFFIDPADLPDPDVYAVGEWTCGCGDLSFSLRGTVGVTCLPQCPQCGEVGEIMGTPL